MVVVRTDAGRIGRRAVTAPRSTRSRWRTVLTTTVLGAALAACATTPPPAPAPAPRATAPAAPVAPQPAPPEAAAAPPIATAPPTPLPAPPAQPARPELRMCADPDDLPYADDSGRGFDNAVGELAARVLNMTLVWEWERGARDRAADLLDSRACDAVLGVPSDRPAGLMTRPYYRTPWLLVQRPGRTTVRRLDDPVLRKMKIGVQLPGRELAATAAGRALVQAGLAANAVPFPMVRPEGTPPGAIVTAVARGALDVALVAGPQAAFFASSASPRVIATPVATAPAAGRDARREVRRDARQEVTLERDVAIAVARDRRRLRDALDLVLDRYRAEIDRTLAAYAVPRADGGSSAAAR
jgi:mxaJ protein